MRARFLFASDAVTPVLALILAGVIASSPAGHLPGESRSGRLTDVPAVQRPPALNHSSTGAPIPVSNSPAKPSAGSSNVTGGNLTASCSACVLATVQTTSRYPDQLVFDSHNEKVYVAEDGGADAITATNNSWSDSFPLVEVASDFTSVAVDTWYNYVVFAIGDGYTGSGAVVVVNDTTDSVANWTSLGTFPTSITFDGRNGLVYVVDNDSYYQSGSSNIQEFFVHANGTLSLNSTVPFSYALQVQYDPLGARLYVAGTRNISAVNDQTLSVVSVLPIAGEQGWASDPTADEIFVSGDLITPSASFSGVAVINATTSQLVRTWSSVQGPLAFDPSNNLLYASEGDIANVSTGQFYGYFNGSFLGNIDSVAYDPSSQDVYFLSADGNGTPPQNGVVQIVSGGSPAAPPSGVGPAVSPSPADPGMTLEFSVDLTPASTRDIESFHWTGLPCASQNSSLVACVSGPSSPLGNVSAATVTVAYSSGWSLWGETYYQVLDALSASLGTFSTSIDVNQTAQLIAGANGGLPPYRFSWGILGAGSGCPLGTNQSSITCFPTAPGSFTASVNVTDALGTTAESAPLTISVAYPLVATISVSNSTPWLGQSIEFAANVSGGLGVDTFGYADLPPGCASVNERTVGCLPTQAGWYNVSVVVTDQDQQKATASLLLHVVFDFTLVAPASTAVGQSMSVQVETPALVSGSALVLSRKITEGSAGGFTFSYAGLPPGCATQDSSTLTCTPTQAGMYSITATVNDGTGDTNQHTVVVRVTEGYLGLPGNDGYLVLGLLAVAAAAVIVVIAHRVRASRKR